MKKTTLSVAVMSLALPFYAVADHAERPITVGDVSRQLCQSSL